MHPRTEDDLSAGLRRLRPVEPRAALEPRVLAAMAAATGRGRAGARPVGVGRAGLDRSAVATGLAAAASIAALFVGLAVRTPVGPSAAYGTASAGRAAVAGSGAVGAIDPLIEASWLLERAIDTLPGPRRVMRADTASTIASLETQIAAIDAALGAAPGDRADGPAREALWRDRVSVMAALYQVRYAQSRTFDY